VVPPLLPVELPVVPPVLPLPLPAVVFPLVLPTVVIPVLFVLLPHATKKNETAAAEKQRVTDELMGVTVGRHAAIRQGVQSKSGKLHSNWTAFLAAIDPGKGGYVAGGREKGVPSGERSGEKRAMTLEH
jgi:hypothetical protein